MFIIALLSLFLLQVAPGSTECLRHGMDFGGADIGHRKAYSLQECFDVCKDLSGCKSFTFRSWTNDCWPKYKRGGNSGPTLNGGLTSRNMECGTTKSDQSCKDENTDYAGADLGGRTAHTFSQCEIFCRDTQNCESITFRASDSQCWLKYRRFGAAGPTYVAGLTSLNMQCSDPISVTDSKCALEGVDFWGADIMSQNADSFGKCIHFCEHTSGCASITYRPSTYTCWLKNKRGGNSGPTLNGRLTSTNMDCGTTKSDQSCKDENMDYWGADLGGRTAHTFNQCETFCRNTHNCESITFRASDSQCWLKYRKFGAGTRRVTGLTSLNMRC